MHAATRNSKLDERTLTRSNDLLVKALQEANQLNRKAMLASLEQNGISTAGQRGVYILQRASLDSLICQGTAHASNQTFMLLDEFSSKAMERDEALAELAKRYFSSHGPATLQDFIWWSGISTAEAMAGLDSIRSQLIEEIMNGRT